MDIGKRIAYFRKQKGYSVNKLANIAGISQSYLRDIELENKNPTVAFLEILCEGLEISLADFFQDESYPSTENDPLLDKIHKMPPSQRNALLKFLDTL